MKVDILYYYPQLLLHYLLHLYSYYFLNYYSHQILSNFDPMLLRCCSLLCLSNFQIVCYCFHMSIYLIQSAHCCSLQPVSLYLLVYSSCPKLHCHLQIHHYPIQTTHSQHLCWSCLILPRSHFLVDLLQEVNHWRF